MNNLDQEEYYSDEEITAYPEEFPFLDDLNLDQDVTRRITIQLQSILRGSNEVYTTPIVKRLPPNVVLGMWDEIFNAHKDRMNDVLIDIEESNRSKFGPRSIAKPWIERIDDVNAYFKPKTPKYYPVLRHYPKQNNRPLEPIKAIDLLKNNTNSGLPFYCRKGKIKSKLLRDFDYLKYRKDPCMLFTRTQENNKTRTVWGFPAIDTLIEMCYYHIVLAYQRSVDWRAAIVSPEQVDKVVTRIIDRALSNNLSILSIDFSSYDASISVNLITEAFKYIKGLFQNIYHDTIDVICKRFYTIPILTPFGVIRGEHGVPSGSTFTNEVDSIVQYIIAKSSDLVYDGDFQIQGDDGIYILNPNDVEDFINHFKRAGLVVNDDKSIISKDYCVYLQKLYHPAFRLANGIIGGIYSTYRALNRIIYQERWANFEDFELNGVDYYSLRTIAILENCKHHPLFREFVKFIYEIDKYSLSYSKESVAKYCNMLDSTQGLSGIVKNQYGQDVKGVKRFETVKMINSFA